MAAGTSIAQIRVRLVKSSGSADRVATCGRKAIGRRQWRTAALSFGLMSCNALVGISEPRGSNAASDTAGATLGTGGATGSAADAGGLEAGAGGETIDARSLEGCGLEAGATTGPWPDWPMPNIGAGLPHPASYDTSTTGVVRDRVTGLMWERVGDGHEDTAPEASAYCRRLTLGGCAYWRLPTRIELVSLLDPAVDDPLFIDDKAFPLTAAYDYWTSSLAAATPSEEWVVNFGFGATRHGNVMSRARYRCVAGALATTPGPGAPPSRYVASNGVVVDTRTTLAWQERPDGTLRKWPEADQYCKTLTLAGASAWRLPSMKELQTIVDESRAHPAAETAVFAGTPASPFWTSSYDKNGALGPANSAWQVDFDEGATKSGFVDTDMALVRCVR